MKNSAMGNKVTLRRKFAICAVVLAGWSQVGCSDSKSQQVDVSFTPRKPVVINADIKILDYTTPDATDTITIASPWFRSELEAKNNSDTPVTIVGFSAIVTSPTGETKEIKSKLGDSNGFYIATVAPGGSYSDPTLSWYFDGLPKGAAGQGSLRYRVSVVIVGWFGTPNDPQERFERKITFTTQ